MIYIISIHCMFGKFSWISSIRITNSGNGQKQGNTNRYRAMKNSGINSLIVFILGTMVLCECKHVCSIFLRVKARRQPCHVQKRIYTHAYVLEARWSRWKSTGSRQRPSHWERQPKCSRIRIHCLQPVCSQQGGETGTKSTLCKISSISTAVSSLSLTQYT